MLKEFSAGGIIIKEGKVLLVLMNTINGCKVWTYPKGHIEQNETAQTAALREVLEETGYECRLLDDKELYISKYNFRRNDKEVLKEVKWYLMEPLKESSGIQSVDEIDEIQWCDYKKASEKLNYKTDMEILNLIKERIKE